MTLDDLHVVIVLMVYLHPVLWLVNFFSVSSIGHIYMYVSYLLAPHCKFPGAPRVHGLISARTKRSCMLLGQRKAKIGGDEIAPLSRSEA